MKLSFPKRRKSTDRVIGFRSSIEGNRTIFLLGPVTPKTGTQIQTAKSESDILMTMFYEH